MKENIDKLKLRKIKNYCFLKDTQRIKLQAIDWEKIFAKRLSDERFTSRVCK